MGLFINLPKHGFTSRLVTRSFSSTFFLSFKVSLANSFIEGALRLGNIFLDNPGLKLTGGAGFKPRP